MSKRPLVIPIALIVLALGAILALLRFLPSENSPLPYDFAQNARLLSQRQLEQTQEATLIIIGDRHGRIFAQYLPLLREKLSPLFRNMAIVNLAQDRHGIHRSLKKLQEISHLPTLVLFLGGYDEFYEDKLDVGQYLGIKKKFNAFEDDAKLILMNIFPWMGPLLTPSLKRHHYNTQVQAGNWPKEPVAQQRELELRFKTYEFELQKLIDQATKNQNKLILTTAPLNLHTPPGQVCASATAPALEQKLEELAKLLQRGDAKTVIGELTQLEQATIGHAGLYHLLGKAYLRQGQPSKARHFLARADSFDCAPEGASHVINNIVRLKARENGMSLIDFDQMVRVHLGRSTAFVRGTFPQHSHYHLLVQRIAGIINHVLKARAQELSK